MNTLNKNKGRLGPFFDLIVFFSIFVVLVSLLNLIFVDYNYYYRILFRGYTEEKHIDNLFVGSSHVYSGINPIILDDLNGVNNFNISTPAQRADSSYFFIKDAIKSKSVSHVYLECYPFIYTNSPEYSDFIHTDNARGRAWSESYFLYPSILKYEIQFHSAPFSEYCMENLFPFVRYRMYAMSREGFDSVHRNILEKSTSNYLNCRLKDGSEEYNKKGFCISNDTVGKRELFFQQTRDYSRDSFGLLSKDYLVKSLDYCKKNKVDVTVIVTPLYELETISNVDYDRFHNQLQSLASKYDVPVYDFNLVKGEYFDTQDIEYYRNIDHLNTTGANAFTKAMWGIISGNNVNDFKEYFYDSYREKREREPGKVFGAYYTLDDEGNRCCSIACNHSRDVRFKISKMENEDDRNETVIQDYSENRNFILPRSENGYIRIEACFDNNPNYNDCVMIEY